jgi:hypothetical protein
MALVTAAVWRTVTENRAPARRAVGAVVFGAGTARSHIVVVDSRATAWTQLALAGPVDVLDDHARTPRSVQFDATIPGDQFGPGRARAGCGLAVTYGVS